MSTLNIPVPNLMPGTKWAILKEERVLSLLVEVHPAISLCFTLALAILKNEKISCFMPNAMIMVEISVQNQHLNSNTSMDSQRVHNKL